MRIEELVLEGFKSYPVRTQITGWDPSFNAITGEEESRSVALNKELIFTGQGLMDLGRATSWTRYVSCWE